MNNKIDKINLHIMMIRLTWLITSNILKVLHLLYACGTKYMKYKYKSLKMFQDGIVWDAKESDI